MLLFTYNHQERLLTITASLFAGWFLLCVLQTHTQQDLTNIAYYYYLLLWGASVVLNGRLVITFWQLSSLPPLRSRTRVGVMIRERTLEVVGLLISTLHMIYLAADMYSYLAQSLSLYMCFFIVAVSSITRHVYLGEPNTRTT